MQQQQPSQAQPQQYANRVFPAAGHKAHTQQKMSEEPTGPVTPVRPPAAEKFTPPGMGATAGSNPNPDLQTHQDNVEQDRALWWGRRGLLGAWLNLTAPPRPAGAMMADLKVREQVRRNEMISISSLLVFAFMLALIGNSLSDPSTGVAVVIMAVVLSLALVFNRLSHPNIASYSIVIFMMLVLVLSLVGAKGGLRMIWMPTYDLFTLPIFLSALITKKSTPIWLSILAGAFIAASFTFLPHAQITSPLGARSFDEIQYEMNLPNFGWWPMINRHVFLNLFAGLFGFLAAYSFEKSLSWAEQSKQETIEANLRAFSREQIAREVSQFLEEVIQAFVNQANGQQNAYIRQRSSNEPFYQEVLLLNERLRRFEMLRRQSGEFTVMQLTNAAQDLSRRLYQVNIGGMPVQTLAPGRFETEIPLIDEIASQIYILLFHQSRQSHYQKNNHSNDPWGSLPEVPSSLSPMADPSTPAHVRNSDLLS
ncbi:hypothetical protein KSC_002990 [Ktedonobacter sp. SOSP1-52]|uniref:hypothetical protein n=1 Tax=Ktedonobacter sp. SOSP1-52 TaxID=2778366 RepID=UPI00191630E5|nr:hypothetical protein [Ktedonobacter sp. SOSP1-52]GHO61407.1 hypothetical protein KSC_002990 [Ktedonobacter sp. SOSP1-52]